MVSRDLIRAALGEEKAELVIKNGTLVNVLTDELYAADVAIYDSRVVGIGDVSGHIGAATKVVDAAGSYLVPGLIDGHIHIECSKLSMSMFADAVVPHGTTSVVSGLDQIYVVAGLNGVREFLNESLRTPLKIFWAAPCKTPYTVPSSTVGHYFGPKDHAISQRWPECVGVWELIKDLILEYDKNVFAAIDIATKNHLSAFGGAAMTTGSQFSATLCAGMRSDHECYSVEETLEKLRSGVYVMIRESSVAHFLKENIRVVTEKKIDPRRIGFCTDDVTAQDLLTRGHLDNVVRLAIQEGVDPLETIKMATINCAQIYRIDHLVGSISPGRVADILLIDKPESFKVQKVISKGKLVAINGSMISPSKPPRRNSRTMHSLHVHKVTPAQLEFHTSLKSRKARILSMKISEETAWVRKRFDADLEIENGVIGPDVEQDVLTVAVIERYGRAQKKVTGFVSGFKLKNGAMASSTAPDDNNIICVGTSADEMAYAVNHVLKKNGGQVVVKDENILEFLPLPIGGIVADLNIEQMAEKETALDQAARTLGCELEWPFMTMIVLEAGGIPDYAITDRGLVDTVRHEVINPVLGKA
ncbi:MAG TPA: adenine deaminase C-terminal domain-containing protein [Candidatus Acidoferrales bacterium]|nr:adenine deaminase C-terminal domain-containing protein [Candidatus Acidoferrales bacterium]